MDAEAILKRFDELGVWKQADQRAPHKPLLVLYALGLWQRGQRDVTFRQAEPAGGKGVRNRFSEWVRI